MLYWKGQNILILVCALDSEQKFPHGSEILVDKSFLFVFYRKHVKHTVFFSRKEKEVMWNSCGLITGALADGVCNTQKWSCKNQSSQEYFWDVILMSQIQIYAFSLKKLALA